jgi:acyl-CoA thioesterase YciA
MTQETGKKVMNMELVSTYVCKAYDIGVHSNMFGGSMVSLVDDAAACYACQICDTPKMVTIKIDELIFKNPVKVGDILKTYATVTEFGRTSVSLYIEVRRHSVHTGEQEIVLITSIKFVRIDSNGKPIPILDHVKSRYAERVAKYGKGLLSTEELLFEKNGKV